MDMGVIAKHKNEIRFYYSSSTSTGKQALALILASEKKVLEIDIAKTKVTGTQWAEIASGLGKQIHELMDTSHPDFIKAYGTGVVMDDQHEWLKILEKNPSVFQRPIIVNGDTYVQLEEPAQVKRILDVERNQIDKGNDTPGR